MTDHTAVERARITADIAAQALLKLAVAELTPGVRVVAMAGELDMLSAPRAEAQIRQELAAGLRGLVLDLSELSFLGSSGLSLLLRTRQEAHRANVPLRLVCTSRAALRPLQATGLLDLFAISDTLGGSRLGTANST